jgi:hypothetical protein
MSNSDVFTYALLAVGLLLVFMLFFTKSQSKFVEKNFSRIIAPIMGAFLFISMIIARKLFFPEADLVSYLIRSLLLSVVMGISIWIVFSAIERLLKHRR